MSFDVIAVVKRIRRIRRARKLRQKDVAAMMGVSPGRYAAWERLTNNELPTDAVKLAALAKILSVSFIALLAGDQEDEMDATVMKQIKLRMDSEPEFNVRVRSLLRMSAEEIALQNRLAKLEQVRLFEQFVDSAMTKDDLMLSLAAMRG